MGKFFTLDPSQWLIAVCRRNQPNLMKCVNSVNAKLYKQFKIIQNPIKIFCFNSKKGQLTVNTVIQGEVICRCSCFVYFLNFTGHLDNFDKEASNEDIGEVLGSSNGPT